MNSQSEVWIGKNTAASNDDEFLNNVANNLTTLVNIGKLIAI